MGVGLHVASILPVDPTFIIHVRISFTLEVSVIITWGLGTGLCVCLCAQHKLEMREIRWGTIIMVCVENGAKVKTT